MILVGFDNGVHCYLFIYLFIYLRGEMVTALSISKFNSLCLEIFLFNYWILVVHLYLLYLSLSLQPIFNTNIFLKCYISTEKFSNFRCIAWWICTDWGHSCNKYSVEEIQSLQNPLLWFFVHSPPSPKPSPV